MAVKLNSSIEEALWADIYKEQIKKASYPIGEHTANAQRVQCSDYADNAVLQFRARAGKYPQVLPVVESTPDETIFTKYDQCYCADDDN